MCVCVLLRACTFACLVYKLAATKEKVDQFTFHLNFTHTSTQYAHILGSSCPKKPPLTLSHCRYFGLLAADSEKKVRHNISLYIYIYLSFSFFFLFLSLSHSLDVSYRTQKHASRYTLSIYCKMQTSVFISYWQAHL